MGLFCRALSGLLCAGLAHGAMALETRQLLFGDTHLHTSYAFDAYLNKNQTADPDAAYRREKGAPVIHPFNLTRAQITTPPDLLVVSDHTELMGVIRAINLAAAEQQDPGWWGNLKAWFAVAMLNQAIEGGGGEGAFKSLLPKPPLIPGGDPLQRAFYYMRVLQIPIPGLSLHDAIALQSEPPEDGSATIQERAHTSPIWYVC